MASSGNGNGKGRKKIKMEKMENQSNLQVTFSKRRNGVFKKAYELTILTGAEVALIVFSPGGKVYTFGHPTVEAVTERFLSGITRPLTSTQQQIQNERNRNVAETNASLDNVKNQLVFERKRTVALNKPFAQSQGSEENISTPQHSLVALRKFSAEVEREINARALSGLQNYIVSGPIPYAGGDSEDSKISLQDAQNQWETSQEEHQRHISVARDALSPFPKGPNGYSIGGWPINAGLSSVGGGGPFVPQPISFSSGVGQFIAGSSSSLGGGEPYIYRPSSSFGGGRPYIDGSSSSFGGGRPYIDGSSSSFGGGRPYIDGSSSSFGGGGGPTIVEPSSSEDGNGDGSSFGFCGAY